RYRANDLPAEGADVEPLYPDKRLDHATGFVLDEVYQFGVTQCGKAKGQFQVKVSMALDGTFYFESARGRLYFGKHEGTFYIYRLEGNDPWLSLLFLALPRLPLSYRDGLTWLDYVP